MQEGVAEGEQTTDPFNYYRKRVNESWLLKKCYFSYYGTSELHYANTPLLTMFVSKFGNILPRSQTFLTAKMQRRLRHVIKRSRQIGLLPYKGTWQSLRNGPFTPETRRAIRMVYNMPCV